MIGLRRRGSRPDGTPADTWRRAIDRLERAETRYFEKIRFIRDRAVRVELRHIGEDLTAAVEVFRQAGRAAGPSVAGSDAALVNAVHRAATLVAHAAEAAMTAHHAAWRRNTDGVARQLDAVRLLVKAVAELADGADRR